MILNKIKTKGKEGFNVVIEIPMNHLPVKYEFDKDSNAIFVDRFMQTSMFYPCNYGFIPHTLSEDSDPVDVLVISSYPLISGCVIEVRPIGVLLMEDESGKDEKILSVPISKIDNNFDRIKDITDVEDNLKQRIIHFFEGYKKLEANKWVKVDGWRGKDMAEKIINNSIV